MLIIQLKHFAYDAKEERQNKINVPLSIPINLNVDEETFGLISRINHIGESTESGHYICHLLEENNSKFVEIDNTRIAKGKTLTRTDDQEVYICIYEKKTVAEQVNYIRH